MVVPPPTPDGLGVLLLDSNAETHFSFTNALGLVGMDQMRAAEAAMAQYPAARWLVALHHHLMEYPRPGAPLADRIGTALVNGHWVLGRLRRVGVARAGAAWPPAFRLDGAQRRAADRLRAIGGDGRARPGGGAFLDPCAGAGAPMAGSTLLAPQRVVVPDPDVTV